MTVVVGLKFMEGMVLAADKEENDTYLKYPVQKIQRLGFPNKMIAGITGDGDAHFIDFSIDKIKDYLLSHSKMPISKIGKGVEIVLKEVFEEHIFATNLSAKERPDFGLLIACIQHGKHKLFKTKQAAPVEIFDFAASGYGASYAEILIRKYWGTLTLHSAVLLGLYVVQQTQKHVSTVGGGMDVVILKSDGKSATLTSSLTKPLGEKLERLDYEFEGAFFSALYGNSWLDDADKFRDKAWEVRVELQAELDRLFADFKL
jgi:20S proteasome alpha/beta subunit